MMLRRFVLLLALAWSGLAPPIARAADATAPPAAEETEPPKEDASAARTAWFAKARHTQSEGSCSMSSVPCCCVIAGGYEGACMTNRDCSNLNGTCVSKAQGCS